ncbi:MAG: hypothetical protein EAZ76_15230 [Nostocales cyanobacterium]|nr:MAG: hypothetical protein EAZ87_23245 [Nostocales cyanobacterium]TAF11150.1 MAG: hypothetical protein EAZ76_15230 [Nostocales cyanobacterium]
MLTTPQNTCAELAINLLVHYSFDLNGYSASEIISSWQKEYPIDWLHLAVIEALYQGRYKAISVQQILNFWQRRCQVSYHFNMEFERMVCSKFPENLTKVSRPVLPSIPQPQSKPIQPAQIPKQLPAQVSNFEHRHQTTAQYPQSQHPESQYLEHEQQQVRALTTPSFKLATDTNRRQLAVSVSKQLMTQGSLSPETELPQLPPANANHPPIGQFTPQRSDLSESFTSKLKAMSSTQPLSVVS